MEAAGSPAWAGIDQRLFTGKASDAREGSPAWAGIDRGGIGLELTGAGFPRVGGDRPASDAREAAADAVPPRGRG